MADDVVFVQSNDRYQVVTVADQGTSTTAPEMRYWYAGAPLWAETVGDDTALPDFHSLNEFDEAIPGSLELPFRDFAGKEADIHGVYVEFNTRPSSISEGIASTYSIGFTASVEGYGVSGYSRTTASSLTTGMHTSTTIAFSAQLGYQADEPWPNTRGVMVNCRLGQRVQRARVVLRDITLVEIVSVKLIGTTFPSRDF